MARPTTKGELIAASAQNYIKLKVHIASMTERELDIPFDFSSDTKKTEAHWGRDKNLRDVLSPL